MSIITDTSTSRNAQLTTTYVLVLHFDINETILIGDDAGGDTVDDCLNKIIAKSAYVQLPYSSSTSSSISTNTINTTTKQSLPLAVTKHLKPTHWWTGDPIATSTDIQSSSSSSPPPLYFKWEWPPNSCPYYRTSFKSRAKSFTSLDGKVYKPLYDELKQCLLHPHSSSDSTSSTTTSPSSSSPVVLPPHFQNILPAFFHTLYHLYQYKKQEEQKHKMNIEYKIVLRTFGTDLKDILYAIHEFASGNHPMYPTFYEPRLFVQKVVKKQQQERNEGEQDDKEEEIVYDCMFRGRWAKSSNNSNDKNSEGNGTNYGHVYNLYSWNDCSENDITTTTGQNSSCTNGNLLASGDEQVLNIIENMTICGINDDYTFWSQNKNAPWAGKPIWIHHDDHSPNENHNGKDCNEQSSKPNHSALADCSSPTLQNLVKKNQEKGVRKYHHLIFDDNIHNDPTDSIVSIRKIEKRIMTETTAILEDENCGDDNGSKKDEMFSCVTTSLDGYEITKEHGKHIIKVPTIAPLLDINWFLKQIHTIEETFFK